MSLYSSKKIQFLGNLFSRFYGARKNINYLIPFFLKKKLNFKLPKK